MHVSICTNVNVGTCTFMHNVPAQKSIQTAGKNKASLFTASEILICISLKNLRTRTHQQEYVYTYVHAISVDAYACACIHLLTFASVFSHRCTYTYTLAHAHAHIHADTNICMQEASRYMALRFIDKVETLRMLRNMHIRICTHTCRMRASTKHCSSQTRPRRRSCGVVCRLTSRAR